MEIVNNTINNSYQSISDAYAGKSIFVTGATGFLGKAFIEKVLYSCPHISKIYILIREKQTMSVDERMRKFLQMPLFDRLKMERPKDLNKIVAVKGDVSLSNLGMEQEDENMLLNTVSMVFHIAATIKFHEPLLTALSTNFKGTKRVLDFCQRIKNIKAFVYVSTALLYFNIDFIEERVYPPSITLDEAEKVAEQSFISEEETAKLLRGTANTYTLSKELAENLVVKYQGIIPATIVRPSIVIASKAEPFVGWIDDWHGCTGIVLPLAQGLNRVLLTDPRNTIDVIPLDYVVNTIIVAATKCEGSKDLTVYNSSSSCENPIEIGELLRLCTAYCVNNKLNIFPFPRYILMTKYKYFANLIALIQRLPVILADWIMYATGKNVGLVKYQKISMQAHKVCERHTNRSWRVCAKRTCDLHASLSETDRERFACDPRNIVWAEYLPIYMEGITRYLWEPMMKKKNKQKSRL